MTEKQRLSIKQMVLFVSCIVLSLVAFNWDRPSDSLGPFTSVRIGTATEGGTYVKIGKALKPILGNGLDGLQVKVDETSGSIENIALLEQNKLELALIQSDVAGSDQVQIVAKLYKEYLHIIVRTDKLKSKTNTIKDLSGLQVALGPDGSGSRVMVEKLLKHFHMDKDVNRKDFETVNMERDALINGDIDALFRVAGLPDQIVIELLENEGMTLLPVAREESLGGFRLKYAGYKDDRIPKGTYSNARGHLPKTETISVTALLVARSNLSADLVQRITEVFDENLVKMRGSNPGIESYLPTSLAFNVGTNPFHFNFHAGAKAFYKREVQREDNWHWMIPQATGSLLLVLGFFIALREGRRMWHLVRVSRYAKSETPNQTMSHDVFLCYCSKEHLSDVERISTTLEEKGISCWYAPRDIPGGRDWSGLIPTAIKQTKMALVLVFSQHANESENISRELTLASSIKLKIIPYLLDNAEPRGAIEYHISNVQWIEAFDQPQDKSLAQLLEALNQLRSEKPTPVLTAATETTPDSIKSLAIEPVSMAARTQTSSSSPPFSLPKRCLHWMAGLGVLMLFGVVLIFWSFTEKVPVLSKPAPGDYVLGGLIYSWEFDSEGKLGVKYEVKRSYGGKEWRSKMIGGNSFTEPELSGEITWEVRAWVPNSNGGMTPSGWSDSRHVEYYKDTLDKIKKRKHVVVAIQASLKEMDDKNPEKMLIRLALEEVVGEKIKITLEPYSFHNLIKLIKGKDREKIDLMAGYISVRDWREIDWDVKFTEPIITHSQAFVRRQDTEIFCIKSRKCRIGVIRGTVNDVLAQELIKGNPEWKVVAVEDVTQGYYKLYHMLLKAKLELLLMDEPFALQLQYEALQKKNPIEVNTVDEVLDNPPEKEKIAIVTKVIDKRLLDVLNDALKKHKEEINRLVKELDIEPLLKQ